MMADVGLRKPPLVLEIGPGASCRGGIASVIGVLEQGLPAEGFQVLRIASQDDRSLSWKIRSAASGLYKTWRHAPGASVAHVHTPSGVGFYRKCAYLLLLHALGCPVVLHIHGGHFGPFLDGKGTLFHRLLFRPLIRRCRLVVALSQSKFSEISDFLPPVPVEVLHNPCMLPVIESINIKEKVDTVLFAGRIEEGKGVFELIQACALLVPSHPSLRLVLAGTGKVEQCRQVAQNLGLGDRVDLVGWLEGADIQNAYKQADIFCLPSHVEGMPMSLLEAMGQGVPSVATCVGAIPEILENGEAGLLVEPRNVNALAECLDRLIGDAVLRRRLAAQARMRIVLHHSREVFCARTARILRQCASGVNDVHS